MPFDSAAFKRRRLLLGFSQTKLAIVAGLSEQAVGRIDRGNLPRGGGELSIDTVSRLLQALQMDWHELVIPPIGNPYEKAVRFAHDEHSPVEAPEFHDRSRGIAAQGIRRMTGVQTAADRAIIDRSEEPAVEVEETIRASDYATNQLPIVVVPQKELEAARDWNFTDPSTE